MNSVFYVYAHYNGDNIVYIGKGQGGRILSTTRMHNKKHLNFILDKLTRGDISFVKFIKTELSEKEAILLERQLIKEHQPMYNKRYTDKQHANAKRIALQASQASMKEVNTPAGVFPSLSEASRFYEVTPGAIWHRIKQNPKEYYYIKG